MADPCCLPETTHKFHQVTLEPKQERILRLSGNITRKSLDFMLRFYAFMLFMLYAGNIVHVFLL